MKISSLNSKITALLKSKGIPLYNAFSDQTVDISKTTAFLYPPHTEKELRIPYPNGTQVTVTRFYNIKLEITGKKMSNLLGDEIVKLLSGETGILNLKLSETKTSKITSLPNFFIEFTIADSTLETLTVHDNEQLFKGLSVYAFIDNIAVENSCYTPHITLADGTEYYGSPIIDGRIYTFKLTFSPLMRDTFISTAKLTFNSSGTYTVSNYTLVSNRLITAEVTSSDNFSTCATVKFLVS